MDCISIS